MARTEVASGEAGSVPERPGLGWGPARARDPPREHPRVGGPGPPPPGAERRPQLPAPLRTPALLPPPYGNLQPQKVTRRRFLGPSARPPPPGQRSCRGDSGRGSGFLGQNLLGRPGRTRGEGKGGGLGGQGEPGNHCPDFFFHQESTRFFPSSKPWPAGGTSGGPEPSKTRPQSVGRPPLPGPVFPGCPDERGAPQHSGAKFSSGSPARPERSGTGTHFGGLSVRSGLSSAP